MKKTFVNAVLLSSFLIFGVEAGAADPVKEYDELLRHASFVCELDNGNYQAAVRYRSPKQTALGDKLMKCLTDYSAKARSDLPLAIKAAKSETVKTALKAVYTDWVVYFGKFDPISKIRYERSSSALKTELLISQ